MKSGRSWKRLSVRDVLAFSAGCAATLSLSSILGSFIACTETGHSHVSKEELLRPSMEKFVTTYKTKLHPPVTAKTDFTAKIKNESTLGEDFDPFISPRYNRPPLNSLIDRTERRVISDVQWLLDFAVIGFPKCGTTSLLHTLHTNATYTLRSEQCNMGTNQIWKVVRALHEHAPDDPTIKRGMKCPRDISNHLSMQNYMKYFPRTSFIISLRHPVLWFESFYNFRFANHESAPSTDKMLGHCTKGLEGVCAQRGYFHDALARLGKTPLSKQERSLLSKHKVELFTAAVPGSQRHMEHKIMLLHMEQMADEDDSRSTQLRHDMEDFIHIERGSIPPIHHIKPDLVKHKGFDLAKTKIDICDSEHDKIRSLMVSKGGDSAQWIKEYFIKSPDVFISSPDYFYTILDQWKIDPCEERRKKITSQLPPEDDDESDNIEA